MTLPAGADTMTLEDVRRWYAEQNDLQEAFSPNQARYPKGHPRAGQWRPKLAIGQHESSTHERKVQTSPEGGDATVEFHKRIAEVHDLIAQGASSAEQKQAIGRKIRAAATMFSLSDAYEKRSKDIVEDRRAIREAMQERHSTIWSAWQKHKEPFIAQMAHEGWHQPNAYDYHTSRAGKSGPDKYQEDYDKWVEEVERRAGPEPEYGIYTEQEKTALKALTEEELALEDRAKEADRDALLGVLGAIRPMGGEKIKMNAIQPFNVEAGFNDSFDSQELADRYTGNWKLAQDDSEAHLKAITKFIPRDWLREANEKGSLNVVMSGRRARHHAKEPMGTTQDLAVERLTSYRIGGKPVWKFVGFARDIWPVLENVSDTRDERGERVWMDHGGNVHFPGDLPNQGGDPTETYVPSKWVPRSRYDGEIRVSPEPGDANRGIWLHEYAHHLEWVLGDEQPGTNMRELNLQTLVFLESRTEDAVPKPLRALTGNENYDVDEMTKEDEFFAPYVGRQYQQRLNVGATAYHPTEVLTMGLQHIFFPEWKRNLLGKDPDMHAFILGLLATV